MALTPVTGAFTTSSTVTSSSTVATKSTFAGKTQSGTARAAVVISISAGTQLLGNPASPLDNSQSPDFVAQWRNALSDRQKADISALTQLQAFNKGMRRSRHDDASLRLQQLLQQFRNLRLLGASAKTLKELAREIKAASGDLAASGDGGGVDPSASVAGMTDAPSTTDAAATTATGAADGAAASDASTTADAGSNAALDAGFGQTLAGDQTTGDDSSASSATTTPASPQQQPAQSQWQQLEQQAADAGARAQQKVNDGLLLQEARSTLSQIEHMLKRIEDAKHHKPTATTAIDKVV